MAFEFLNDSYTNQVTAGLDTVEYWPGNTFHSEQENALFRNYNRYYAQSPENHTLYDFKRDPYFPNYAANLLPGTQIGACVGPVDQNRLSRFLDDIAFNPKMSIGMIWAIGNGVGWPVINWQKDVSKDFLDYFQADRCFVSRGAFYTIKSKLVDKFGLVNGYQLTITREKKGVKQEKALSVYYVRKEDGGGKVFDAEQIKLFDRLYKQGGKSGLMVHCHAGVGRTGCLLLTHLLLKDFDKIFVKDAKVTAKNIEAKVAELRQTRPIFIHGRQQLNAAVINAINIYNYRLQQESKLEQTATISVVMPELSTQDNADALARRVVQSDSLPVQEPIEPKPIKQPVTPSSEQNAEQETVNRPTQTTTSAGPVFEIGMAVGLIAFLLIATLASPVGEFMLSNPYIAVGVAVSAGIVGGLLAAVAHKVYSKYKQPTLHSQSMPKATLGKVDFAENTLAEKPQSSPGIFAKIISAIIPSNSSCEAVATLK